MKWNEILREIALKYFLNAIPQLLPNRDFSHPLESGGIATVATSVITKMYNDESKRNTETGKCTNIAKTNPTLCY